MNEKRKEIVASYVQGYNNANIDLMCQNLSDTVEFRNTENGIVTLTTTGLEEFKAVFQKSLDFFKYRKQHILQFDEAPDCIIVYVDFEAVLKADLSEQLTKGTTLKFGAKSVFNFKDDTIIGIEDYS